MTMIASERIEACVRVVVDAARKATEASIKDLERRGVVNSNNFQRVLAQGDKMVAAITATVTETLAELAENIVGRLRLISGGKSVVIGPTDGRETIARAEDVFVYIDSDFKNYGCDVKSGPTAATEVSVYEMIKDGTFAQIFGGFGENLDRLCLTQAQIKAFVRDQRSWLRTDGYGTFFLFKVGGEFFVAGVDVSSHGLYVFVYRFSSVGVWGAEDRRRVVVPQLALET